MNSVNRITTCLISSTGSYTNDSRLSITKRIIEYLDKEASRSGIVLLPAGWFNSGSSESSSIYRWVEDQVGRILNIINSNIIVCLGIDGRVMRLGGKDQIGAAIGKEGFLALGRKFYPAPVEEQVVDLAGDHLEKEAGMSRCFEFNGKKYFIAVCYDSFGIRKKSLKNCDIDAILNTVHGFYPKGEGNSGDVYFAKHGFAGASKQWHCPVFGSAVFINRKIPSRWPSGVNWNKGELSTQKWGYEDNPIKPSKKFKATAQEGEIQIRIFN